MASDWLEDASTKYPVLARHSKKGYIYCSRIFFHSFPAPMKVISKIENVEGLKNFEAVLEIIRSGYQVVRRQEFDWEHFGFDTANWESLLQELSVFLFQSQFSIWRRSWQSLTASWWRVVIWAWKSPWTLGQLEEANQTKPTFPVWPVRFAFQAPLFLIRDPPNASNDTVFVQRLKLAAPVGMHLFSVPRFRMSKLPLM